MALDLSKFRLLPMASQTRIGTQSHVFALGSDDDLNTCLETGYLDKLADKKVTIDNRLIQDNDLIFLNYAVSGDAGWTKCYVYYDDDADTYQLRLASAVRYNFYTSPASADWNVDNLFVGVDHNGTIWIRGYATALVAGAPNAVMVLPEAARNDFNQIISVRNGNSFTGTAEIHSNDPVTGLHTTYTTVVNDELHMNFPLTTPYFPAS